MANQQADGMGDDFFEQIFSMPPYGGAMAGGEAGMVLQLGSGEGSVAGAGGFPVFPLQLSLEHGKGGFPDSAAGSGSGGKRFHEDNEGPIHGKTERDPVQLESLFPAFGQVQTHQIRPNTHPQVFQGQVMHGGVAAAPQQPAPRPRARARRGQATDPHSIAERQRRERIAERLRALQDLVPNTNKTDKAAMLDEILDYVKFLRLQVKVLSMSRLGGTGAVAQLVADIPLSSLEGEGGSNEQMWEKWSTDGTEAQVAKLMGEDVGAAMQLLQSKALCMMPISLATAIYPTNHLVEPPSIKPEPNTPS